MEIEALTNGDLADIYTRYIACLNRQDWLELREFVHPDVRYNGQLIRLSGYQQMLENNFSEIPDLHFDIELLICDPPYIASRLKFDCAPKGSFLGLEVNGRRLSFAENVFYQLGGSKLQAVWSVVDKAAIEAQLR